MPFAAPLEVVVAVAQSHLFGLGVVADTLGSVDSDSLLIAAVAAFGYRYKTPLRCQ